MTELSDHDKQGLADLATLPSYMHLMAMLVQYEEAVLDELARAGNDAARIQHGRFYQFLNRMRQVLQHVPQNAAAEMDALREMDADNVAAGDQLWVQRYGGHNVDQGS